MRRHLTYSNVAATLALLIVVGLTPAGAHVTEDFGHLWKKHIVKKIDYKMVTTSQDVAPNGADYYDSATITIPCPAGKEALGGGYYQSTVGTSFVVDQSRPTDDYLGWQLRVHNGETYTVTVTGYAICANLK